MNEDENEHKNSQKNKKNTKDKGHRKNKIGRRQKEETVNVNSIERPKEWEIDDHKSF